MARTGRSALARIAKAVSRQTKPLRGADRIGLAVGQVFDRHKMARHFNQSTTDDSFSFTRSADAIAAEPRLDGIYVIRTNVPAEQLAAPEVVASYKSLSRVERAFRSIKAVDLEVRPIHHRLADRVRAHLLLCMLAYYVEWHRREALAPVLFDDHERAAGAAERSSIVAPARRSTAARHKAAHKRTADALPVLSFRSLLGELATFSRNTMAVADAPEDTFLLYPQRTALQTRTFELLGVSAHNRTTPRRGTSSGREQGESPTSRSDSFCDPYI